MIGTKIENYRITSVLGEGGMGVVYKAFDLKLERYVALKILNEKAVTNPQFVERFKREAKHQAQLSHPNIVPVFGFADDRNFLGFVMEYVNGETLEQRIEKKGSLHYHNALEIMKQVLGGAAYAHSRGFIHRDLKPSNIIFTQDEIAKIMDFGISKSVTETKGITRSGVKIGTLLYMSPEQIKAYEPTQQSDIYALGVIFYEMITGKNPFDGESDFQIMEAHLKKYPPRLSSIFPDIPEEIDRIVFKALAKSTEKRYQDAQEFYEDVEQELIRLKSEQRKTREILLKRETKKESSLKVSNYVLISAALVLSIILIYLAYNSVAKNFKTAGPRGDDTSYSLYDSSPYKFMNTGWRKIIPPVNESLTAIQFNDDSGVITGFNGTVLISNDAGDSWRKIETGTNSNLYSLRYLGLGNYFITGENGGLFKLNVKDGNLKKIKTRVSESLFDSFFQPDMKTGFVSGGSGTILRTTDGGESWNQVYTSSDKLIYSVSFSDSRRGYAVGWDGELLETTDGGSSWISRKLSANYLRNIYFLNKNTGFISGGEGSIFKTTDGGKNWRKIESGISSGLYFVSFINEENGYILGSRGEILYSEDLGENWHVIQSGSFVSLTNISVSQKKALFVIGYNGTILVSR